MSAEIAVPFRLDGLGRVVSITDPDAQVRQHVLALVGTHPYERAMVPGYGTDLTGVMFEEQDEVETQVSIRVSAAMVAHEPGVELLEIIPTPNENTEGFADVSMEYRRLDAPDSSSLANANQAIIGVDGTVREVVRG